MKMKSVNKIATVVAVILMCAVILGAFIFFKQKNEPMPDDEIILSYEEINWAWGFSYRIFFMDTNGDVYAFDSSTYFYNVKEFNTSTLLDKMMVVRENTEPVATIDKAIVQKIYNYGMKIDAAASYAEEGMAFDAGQGTIAFRNPKSGEIITCYSSGDYLGELQDENAKKLVQIYEKKVARNIQTEDIPYLYTEDEIPFVNIHCGYQIGNIEQEGLYVAEDAEEFYQLLGCYPHEMLPNLIEEHVDIYVYFINYVEVPTTGYDLKSFGIMENNGKISFVDSKDNVYPKPGETVGEAMDGFCSIAAYPVATLEADLAEYKMSE